MWTCFQKKYTDTTGNLWKEGERKETERNRSGKSEGERSGKGRKLNIYVNEISRRKGWKYKEGEENKWEEKIIRREIICKEKLERGTEGKWERIK